MRLYKASELLEVKKLLSIVLKQWGIKWLSPNIDLEVERVTVFENSRELTVINGLHIDISGSSLTQLILGKDISLNEAAEKIVNDVWYKSKEDLIKAIGKDKLLTNHNFERSLKDLSKLGSGALYIECVCAERSLPIVLTKELVECLVSEIVYETPHDPLVKAHDAISNESIIMTLTTNPLECSYLQVKDLKVGDVLKINHNVSEPLKMFLDGEKQVARAFLARTGSTKTAVIEG